MSVLKSNVMIVTLHFIQHRSTRRRARRRYSFQCTWPQSTTRSKAFLPPALSRISYP